MHRDHAHWTDHYVVEALQKKKKKKEKKTKKKFQATNLIQCKKMQLIP